jgi:uncharacterized membrane protein YoaK (UPF0700 family)
MGGEGRLLDPDQAPVGTPRRPWQDEEFAPGMTDMSALDVAAGAIRRDETVSIVLLLAFAGGFIDAYAWTLHGVLANAQTANLIFLWVYGMAGNWAKAFHFVPPILSFAGGIVLAAWLRRVAGQRASALSVLLEIVLLIVIGVLHNRMPAVAGTLGLSLVAAMQAGIFTKVEGVPCSTVMITGNMRQAVENSFAVVAGGAPAGTLRRTGIFAALCAAYGFGAAVGAFITRNSPELALLVPVVALLIVLLFCEFTRPGAD